MCRQAGPPCTPGDRVAINQGTHHLGAGVVDDITHEAAVVG